MKGATNGRKRIMLTWKKTSADWEARTSKIFIILRPKAETNLYSGDIFILNTFLCIPISPFTAESAEDAHIFVENNLRPILKQAVKFISLTLETLTD